MRLNRNEPLVMKSPESRIRFDVAKLLHYFDTDNDFYRIRHLKETMKILMVCLGNICRSPLAEGILKQKAQEHDLEWEVDSAGTGAWHIGERPDRRSIAKAHEYGIDITAQRARQLKPEDLSYFDLILTMDESNYRHAFQLASSKEQEAKVKMIMDYVSPGQRIDVPDPYWDDDGFEQVYQMLERACGVIVEKYR